MARRLVSRKDFGSSPSTDVLLRKFSGRAIAKQAAGANAPIPYDLSDASVDRDADTVAVEGWVLDNYNGVVLWGHDPSIPAIGKSTVRIEGGALKGLATFTPRDMNAFGGMIGDMVRAGFMPSCSVGFRPLEWEVANDRVDDGERGFFDPLNFLKQELLEWSVVNIPANPNAGVTLADEFARAKSAGVDVSPASPWAEEILSRERGAGLWVPRKDAEAIAALFRSARVFDYGRTGSLFDDGAVPRESTAPEAKGAVPYSSAPVDEEAWSAAQATKRLAKWASSDGSGDKDTMDWAKYRKGFAWYDDKNPENFGSYKLPHHDVKDGKLVTVKAGVFAAAAVLSGGRGGADITDVAAVKAHIAKHYHQWGDKAPWESDDDGKSLNESTVGSGGALTSEGDMAAKDDAAASAQDLHDRMKAMIADHQAKTAEQHAAMSRMHEDMKSLHAQISDAAKKIGGYAATLAGESPDVDTGAEEQPGKAADGAVRKSASGAHELSGEQIKRVKAIRKTANAMIAAHYASDPAGDDPDGDGDGPNGADTDDDGKAAAIAEATSVDDALEQIKAAFAAGTQAIDQRFRDAKQQITGRPH